MTKSCIPTIRILQHKRMKIEQKEYKTDLSQDLLITSPTGLIKVGNLP